METAGPLQIWDKLDKWERWMVISALVAFAILMMVVCYIGCVLGQHAHRGTRISQKDDVQQHIAMSIRMDQQHVTQETQDSIELKLEEEATEAGDTLLE